MEGQAEAISPPTQSIESTAQTKIQEKILGIVKNRLTIITQEQLPEEKKDYPPEKQQLEERTNTAKVLLGIINGQTDVIETFTTAKKPIELTTPSQQTTPTSEIPSEQQPADQTREQPTIPEILQRTTYTVSKIENQVIYTKDQSGKEFQFNLGDLAIDMAKTLNMPDHQIETIKNHLSGQPIDNITELAKKFGFLTKENVLDIFGIPATKEEREKLIADKKKPEWQKKLTQNIDQLPEIPETDDVVGLFEAAELPVNEPIEKAYQKILSSAENLPEERKQAFSQLVEVTKQLSDEGTIAQAIHAHYQRIEKGEDIDHQETRNLIGSLFNTEKFKNQISQEQQQKIFEKAKKFGKTGGMLAALMAILFIWQGSKEMRGSQK